MDKCPERTFYTFHKERVKLFYALPRVLLPAILNVIRLCNPDNSGGL